MRHLLFIALLACGLGAAGQTTKTAPKTAPAAKKQAASPKKAATKSSGKSAKRRVPPRPRIQQQPTPERYTEIQKALIGRGFLQPPATGVWGPESAAALKSFQEGQKLTATGKIDALTLLRLGLGPKKSTAAQGAGIPPAAASQKAAQP